MNSYILLRDNKESASLGLEDLRRMGLKRTDLIWVECQSWDWQRPEEIPELKALLNGNSKASSAIAIPSTKKDKDAVSSNGSGSTKESSHLKIKYTVLPETAADPVPAEKKIEVVKIEPLPQKEETKVPEQQEPIKKYQLVVPKPEHIYSLPTNNDMYKYGGITTDEPKTETVSPIAATKYAYPVDEVKEPVPTRKSSPKKQKGFIALQLTWKYKQAIIYTGLVAAGAVIMLLINRSGNKQKLAASKEIQTILPLQTKQVLPDTAENNEATNETIIQDPVAINENSDKGLTEEKNTVVPDKPKEEKKLTEEEPVINKKDNDGSTIVNKQTAHEVITTKPVITEDLSSKVSLKANNYVVGSFGGIKNLEMTISNASAYSLEQVTVELRYLNLDDVVVRKENIIFQHVSAGGSSTVSVKKSNRGVKVAYSVIKIEAKEENNSTTGL